MRLLFDQNLSWRLREALQDLIIWIRRGNCSTREIETLLRKHRDSVLTFYEDEQEVVLALV